MFKENTFEGLEKRIFDNDLIKFRNGERKFFCFFENPEKILFLNDQRNMFLNG